MGRRSATAWSDGDQNSAIERDWSTACPDWENRLLAGGIPITDLPLFKEEAEKALRVFKRLRLPDVVGTPRNGDACRDWVFAIVAAIFGSFDPAVNRRMIQEFFLLIPKKNSKSSSAAAIMVTAAIMNRRPNAEFLLIAPTKEIAGIAFKQASGIIKLDPELSKLFQIQSHVKTITHRLTGAAIQIKAADEDTITGSKATGILVDETHVFAKRANAADVFVEVRGSLASRPDGFLLQITTQSKDPPSGVFRAELNKARDVRDGLLRLPLLPILYELPERYAADNGWKNTDFWPLVNPNLGVSVDRAFLSDQLISAERDGPAALALLASQHFNVEIGLGLRSDRWAGADFWEANSAPLLGLDDLLAQCDVAVVGIDGGGLDDLLGLAVLGRARVDRRWLLWAHAWAHKIVLQRRKEIAPRLLDFASDGDLTIVEQPGDDVAEVVDIVAKVDKLGLLPEKGAIGVDAFGIGDVVDALAAEGFSSDRVIGVLQGWKLTAAIRTTERKLAGGELVHSGSPLMAWCVGNAKVEPRGNAISITKQAAGSAKIDPLMATFDAVSLMALNPEPSRRGRARALIL